MSDHVKVLREMFAVCANERRMKEADALDAAIAALAAAPQPQESEFFPIPAGLHPHTVNLVARFAAALADKLAKAERKYGYSDGWADADWMDECRAKLIEHVAKGDPRDVAAYCAFLWHHNERTAITPPAPQPQAQDKTRPVSEWIAELRQDPEIAAGMDAAREKRGPRRTPPAHGDGEGVELLPCPRCQSDSNEHVMACRLDFDLLCARCEVCGLAVAEQWVMPWDNAAHVGIWNRATRPTPEDAVCEQLHVLADIRFAIGDNGKRMQPELVAYIAELAREAARYRWLRDCDMAGDRSVHTTDYSELLSGATLDAAIDAAMQNASGGRDQRQEEE